MTYFRCRVESVTALTPHLRRVTLTGPDLAAYEAEGRPDDYCTVLFPHDGQEEPVVPEIVDGLEVVPDGQVAAIGRNYTIRRYDAASSTVVIDFAVHERGIGTGWVRRAQAGDAVALSDAHGLHAPPPEASWQHLAGDLTSVPAMARILEEAEPGALIHVTVVVPHAADRADWETRAAVTTDWIVEPDPRRVGEKLLEAVVSWTRPEGAGYTWVTGENTACRLARRHLRHELGLPGDQYATLGYWRVDDERWLRQYEKVRAEIERKIHEAGERLADDGDFHDEVDRIYDEAGLGW